eukprot:Filipodium_phascolosomae@DN2181_c0_g1_i1.p1
MSALMDSIMSSCVEVRNQGTVVASNYSMEILFLIVLLIGYLSTLHWRYPPKSSSKTIYPLLDNFDQLLQCELSDVEQLALNIHQHLSNHPEIQTCETLNIILGLCIRDLTKSSMAQYSKGSVEEERILQEDAEKKVQLLELLLGSLSSIHNSDRNERWTSLLHIPRSFRTWEICVICLGRAKMWKRANEIIDEITPHLVHDRAFRLVLSLAQAAAYRGSSSIALDLLMNLQREYARREICFAKTVEKYISEKNSPKLTVELYTTLMQVYVESGLKDKACDLN